MRRRNEGGALQLLRGLGALVLLWAAVGATAGVPEDTAGLLDQADRIKSTDHTQFVAILGSLAGRSAHLSTAQKERLGYLKAWEAVVEGDNQAAEPVLKQIAQHSADPTLKFRAGTTLMNLYELAGRYEPAYAELDRVLEQLPKVSDRSARQQALLVAAQLYRAVKQTDLSLAAAQSVIEENWNGRGVCRGGQQRLAALFESGRLSSVGTEFQAGVDACEKLGESLYSNDIITHAAKLFIDQNRLDDAIALLKGHYEAVTRTQYPRLIAQFDALLADAYRRKGAVALAQSYATSSLEHALKGPYADSVITANLVLYELAQARGDFKAALGFHERYAAADRGYMDDISARQLAYNKVSHENLANKLQIAGLTRQNEVLKLQKALAAEALENSRLYVVLLATILVFIGLWAYRTKRSQLHFMSLSRLDGLTGISNRHHFISKAETALESARRSQKEMCVILWDLDHFKAINDRYGHAMGDFVLQESVSRCRVHVQPHEAFGRFGGEEFSVVLPESGPEAARRRAEQLRSAIGRISVDVDGDELKVSASFGIATTRTSGYELRQLLAHADAALYQAKAAGRNRVVLHAAAAVIESTVSPVVPRSAVGS
jgi:diguanylate cyclase (GGDEF)-like protein